MNITIKLTCNMNAQFTNSVATRLLSTSFASVGVACSADSLDTKNKGEKNDKESRNNKYNKALFDGVI